MPFGHLSVKECETACFLWSIKLESSAFRKQQLGFTDVSIPKPGWQNKSPYTSYRHLSVPISPPLEEYNHETLKI